MTDMSVYVSNNGPVSVRMLCGCESIVNCCIRVLIKTIFDVLLKGTYLYSEEDLKIK